MAEAPPLPRLGAGDLERALRQRAASARAKVASLKRELAAEEAEKAELDRRFKDAVKRRDEIAGWVEKKERALEDARAAYEAKIKARPLPFLRLFVGKAYDTELEEMFDEVNTLEEQVNIGQAQLGDAQTDVFGAKRDRSEFKPRPPEERAEEQLTFERHAKIALLAVTRIPLMQVGTGITVKQALERSAIIGQKRPG